MTICIAAACEVSNSPRIVLGFDKKVSADIWSSETEFKLAEILPGRLMALWSGDASEALELISIYRAHFAQLPELKIEDLKKELSVPLRLLKRRKAEHLVAMRLGFTMAEFHAKAENISKPVFEDVWKEITNISLEASLLIVGFFPHEVYSTVTLQPYIFRVRMDSVEIISHFACIGDGTDAAEHALHRRKQSDSDLLASTIYNVYEAKRFAELAPSVGPETYVLVLAPWVKEEIKRIYRMRGISADGLKFLDRCYKEYGPRRFSIKVPKDMKNMFDADADA